MNVGYGKFNDRNANAVCPLCGSNIYVFKNELNYACINHECLLGKGANECIERINKIIYNILDDNTENNLKEIRDVN